jgi:hypothetical protein
MGTQNPAAPASRIKPRAITVALWAVGIGLQLAAPLLRDRVPLSDELFIDSMVMPV